MPIAILKSAECKGFQELEGSEGISITDLMSEDLYLCVAVLLEHDISITDLKGAPKLTGLLKYVNLFIEV